MTSMRCGKLDASGRRQIRRIAVYCGSAAGNNPQYLAAAEAFGTALAESGIALVYGGGNVGMMGALAAATQAAGGAVTGVITHYLKDKELAREGLDALEIVDTMPERKARMIALADAFVALPGGIGTLEELTEVLCRQQLAADAGPVGLYNVAGFFTPLLDLLKHLADEGFLPRRYLDTIVVAATPAQLIDALITWQGPGLKW